MNRTRFAALAEAYGSDLKRWPTAERIAADAWATENSEATAILQRERGLDRVLSAYPVAQPSLDLQRRIATRLLAEARQPGPIARWLAAVITVGALGAVGAGAAAGAAVIAVVPGAASHAGDPGGIYEQSSFGDLGSAEDGAAT